MNSMILNYCQPWPPKNKKYMVKIYFGHTKIHFSTFDTFLYIYIVSNQSNLILKKCLILFLGLLMKRSTLFHQNRVKFSVSQPYLEIKNP